MDNLSPLPDSAFPNVVPPPVVAPAPVTVGDEKPVELKKKKSNVLPIIGGVVALLVVIVVALFSLYGQEILQRFRGDIRQRADYTENDCGGGVTCPIGTDGVPSTCCISLDVPKYQTCPQPAFCRSTGKTCDETASDMQCKGAGTGGDCTGGYWMKYSCPNQFGMGNGCQQNAEGPFTDRMPAFTSPYCGTQQIDCSIGSNIFQSTEDNSGCVPSPTPTPTGTTTLTGDNPTPTPTGTTAPTPTPTGTITPTLTPTGTITPTMTPTGTLTPTATPTGTLTPTSTPTGVLTPTPTNIPGTTPTPTTATTLPDTGISLPTLGALGGGLIMILLGILMAL